MEKLVGYKGQEIIEVFRLAYSMFLFKISFLVILPFTCFYT